MRECQYMLIPLLKHLALKCTVTVLGSESRGVSHSPAKDMQGGVG